MRFERQQEVVKWAINAFGHEEATSIKQRGLRYAEESIEVAQAAGIEREKLHELVDYIYNKDIGDLRSEIGGAGIVLLALADAAGVSADEEEERELNRILSKPVEYWRKRNAVKNEAGFSAKLTQ